MILATTETLRPAVLGAMDQLDSFDAFLRDWIFGIFGLSIASAAGGAIGSVLAQIAQIFPQKSSGNDFSNSRNIQTHDTGVGQESPNQRLTARARNDYAIA